MIPSHDPVESFFNSVHALHSGLRRAAHDLDHRWRDGARPPPPDWFPIRSFMSGNGRATADLPVEVKTCRREDDDRPFSGCLNFVLGGLAQAFPSPFRAAKKRKDPIIDPSPAAGSKDVKRKGGKVEAMPFDPLLCCFVDKLVHYLHLFDKGGVSEVNCVDPKSTDTMPNSPFDHVKAITGIIKGKKADVDSFLANVRFARVGGAPTSLVDLTRPVKEEGRNGNVDGGGVGREETEVVGNSAQKIVTGLLNIPLSNVERLKSTLSAVSLAELIEYVPQMVRLSKDHPDKKDLSNVQYFFRYTEAEGRRFFEELDRDGDGKVTLEDLEVAMKRRKLPRKYAKDFFRRTRSHFFSKSFGWKQFLSLIKQKEFTILRAYNTLCLSKSGTLQKNHILTSLKSAGLPANEDNAIAMIRYLVPDTEGSISYGHFRNFMLLLPSERLEEDPRSIWFEAATIVVVSPPVQIPAENVLKSALAGGLACAISTSVMHPVDTMKTRVQASSLSFGELLFSLPQIGVRHLYRGSIPAIIGQFSSHGLRTGIFEASKLVLINVAPTLPDIQVQSLASFCSTILGTAVRIPCEVMKQRLQAGIFDNVGEAFVGTLREDGFKGFFRGTGATLCREVPFYVAGMGLYAEAKKATQNILQRELEPWETIMVGALSGGLAAIVTTPFDVMKTRMMTAPPGVPVSMPTIALSILRQEGPLGLFKGAVPRFFWIAPLGAMNFAGYELAKKAMVSNPDQGNLSRELLSEKRT